MTRFDVAILGGGIAGLGVAEACAQRGLSTVILEAQTVAHAASNNTLRIIHGGFRYLQQLNIPRVVRSLNDQSYVARAFPDSVKPLPCLMPLARSGLKSRWPVTAAALLYGGIMKACRSPLPIPTVLSSKEVSALAPELASVTPRGALCWHDLVMTEPHRIHVQLTEQLRSRKTEIREHTRAVAVVKSENGFRVQSGDGLEVEAATIINTLGAWLGSISIPDDLRGPQPKWCLGFNLIVSKQLHPTYACGVQSPDGRLFFCVPRGAHTAIGTWYIPYPATPNTHASGAKPEIPEQAMKDFIASFNRSFPSYQIRTEDICAFDAGVLPMKAERQNGPELFGSEIISSRTGYCEVMSTKYTTFHSQGQRALETVLGNIQKI